MRSRLSMMIMCVRMMRGTQAAIAAVLSVTLLLLLPPCESLAQDNPAGEQSNPTGEIESPQEDDGIDSNLVPLEPELMVSPPGLPSTDGNGIGEQPVQTPDKAAPDTPGTASADAQGPL